MSYTVGYVFPVFFFSVSSGAGSVLVCCFSPFFPCCTCRRPSAVSFFFLSPFRPRPVARTVRHSLLGSSPRPPSATPCWICPHPWEAREARKLGPSPQTGLGVEQVLEQDRPLEPRSNVQPRVRVHDDAESPKGEGPKQRKRDTKGPRLKAAPT